MKELTTFEKETLNEQSYKMFMINNKELFKQNLNYYLEKNNSSQVELADKLEVKQKTFQNYLNEKKKYPPYSLIPKIAQILEINELDLFKDNSDYIAMKVDDEFKKLKDENTKDKLSSKLFNIIPKENKKSLIEKEENRNNLISLNSIKLLVD